MWSSLIFKESDTVEIVNYFDKLGKTYKIIMVTNHEWGESFYYLNSQFPHFPYRKGDLRLVESSSSEEFINIS